MRVTLSKGLIICLGLLMAVPITILAERLPIKVYTIADGLARDSVNRIVRDSHGFLWFCTSEGLSRFDGYLFTNYGTSQGLPTRQVNDLIETRGGVYWVATNGGVCRFIPDATTTTVSGPHSKFVFFSLGDNSKVISANALIEDHDGVVWCGTEGGLYRLQQIEGEWRASVVDLPHPSGYPDEFYVHGLMVDRRGVLWITTKTGLYRRGPDGRTERFGEQEGLPASESRGAMLEDTKGRLWACTGKGLYQLVPEPQPGRNAVARVWTTKDGLAHNFINSLYQASDGSLWVASINGVSELLPAVGDNGQSFRSYRTTNGLSDPLIKTIAEDRDGNIWLGSESGGAMKIAANGFTSFNEADGLISQRVSTLLLNRAGELCAIGSGIDKAFIHRFDGQSFGAVELTLPHGITYWGWGWYQTMFQDRTGEWWVPTGQGLVRYPRLDRLEQITHATPKEVYTTRQGLAGNELFRLFEDSGGDIWISTFGQPAVTLTRWERATGTFHRYSSSEGIPEAVPTAFCEDRAGNLWIGFYTGEVARYRAGHFKLFTEADRLPKGLIRSLYFDSKQRLWIATSEGGVVRLDDPQAEHPQFVVYTTAQGLSSNQVTCVTEDQWGQIYLGTGRGVDRLETETGHIKHYTTADGLASNYINISLRDRSGALWFGTLQGLSRLIPQPNRPTLPPPVLISGLRIAGVSAPLSELGSAEVVLPDLPASRNNLEIDFHGLSFGSGDLLRYQYRLEGTNPDWNQPTEQRRITFANLAPGAYRFLVWAVSADGTISQTPASVVFRILPPFWRSWWFLTLAALLVASAPISLYRYRVARLRAREERLAELERVRRRIATDLHDDIGPNLTQISILSEVVSLRIGPDSGVAEPLTKIASASRELVDAMSDIVWAINPQKDHLSDLTMRMRRFATDSFSAGNIRFHLRLPGSENEVRLGANLRREIFLIFKEAINNLVRHSGCTEAAVDLGVEVDHLTLSLRDNGLGFDLTLNNHGHGLMSMRDRARSIGATFEMISQPGQGTTITLRVPLDRQLLSSD